LKRTLGILAPFHALNTNRLYILKLIARHILASEKALRRAARQALEIGIKTGTPVYPIKK